MKNFQKEKNVVLAFYDALEGANEKTLPKIFKEHTDKDYHVYAVHPFNELKGVDEAVEKLWKPLYHSFSSLQRRSDIFIAGSNEIDGEVWTINMGHFMGIFAQPWLGIPATNRITFLRFGDFHCVQDGKITKSAFFCDIIGVMNQAGLQPLPMQTGDSFIYPGPRTHDGLLYNHTDPAQGIETSALVNRMIDDLTALNISGNDNCPPELLQKTWRDDMIWYGPTGIGASYTIPLYQKRHQFPFRENLTDKIFNGHICRLSEGNFAGFFGWPNLNNTPIGGFLGLPSSTKNVSMRVVDIYRREGDKLAENWVIIDLPYWLKQQGLDILERCQEITNG